MPATANEQSIAIIAVDPGIQTTGYCVSRLVYSVNNSGQPEHHYAFRRIGGIKTDSHIVTDERVRFILRQLKEVIPPTSSDSKVVMVVEMPPETIYSMKFETKDKLIGRAVKLFKVIAVVSAIVTYCQENGIEYRLLKPNQWQPSKKARGGQDTKDWSIKNAKSILSNRGISLIKHRVQLQDHNVCDAININAVALQKFNSNEWRNPYGS